MKKNSLIYTVLSSFLIMLIFVGCTTTGSTQLDSIEKKELKQKIIKNKSTMEEIVELIGEPTSTKTTSQNHEIWTYTFSSSRETIPSYIPLINDFSKGIRQKKKTLIIYFHPNRVVKNYTYSTKNIEKNSGFLH